MVLLFIFLQTLTDLNGVVIFFYRTTSNFQFMTLSVTTIQISFTLRVCGGHGVTKVEPQLLPILT